MRSNIDFYATQDDGDQVLCRMTLDGETLEITLQDEQGRIIGGQVERSDHREIRRLVTLLPRG